SLLRKGPRCQRWSRPVAHAGIENRRTMTVEEYFQLETNDPETRYEYIDLDDYERVEVLPDCDDISWRDNISWLACKASMIPCSWESALPSTHQSAHFASPAWTLSSSSLDLYRR